METEQAGLFLFAKKLVNRINFIPLCKFSAYLNEEIYFNELCSARVDVYSDSTKRIQLSNPRNHQID